METIKQTDILKFWLPLASSWFVMALEGPLVASSIARLEQPDINLAAYGLSFSLALFIEAPGVMILSATTTLVRDRASYIRMKQFTFMMAAIGMILGAVFVFPSSFDSLSNNLNLSKEVSQLFHQSAIFAIALPLILGVKRFYQGILIWGGKTKYIFKCTLLRTAFLFALVGYTPFFGAISGSELGILFLIFSSLVEALALIWVARGIKPKEEDAHSSNCTYSFSELMKFYFPLCVVAFLGLGLQPAVTFLVSKSPLALDSLAVLPVVLGVVFIFRCLGISFNEAILGLLRQNPDNKVALRGFAYKLGIGCFFLFSVMLIPKVSELIMLEIASLPKRLLEIAQSTLLLFLPIPLLTLWNTWQKALAVNQRNSRLVSQASFVELFATLGLIYYGIEKTSLPGANLAALGMVTGRIASITWFYVVPRFDTLAFSIPSGVKKDRLASIKK